MRGSLKPGVKQRAETKIYGHKTVVSTLLAITGLLKMGIDIGIEKKSRTLTDVGRSVIFYSVIVLSCILPITAWADQTCKDSIVATTPDANFTINSDGTVTHKTTGLMWMRCSLGQTWDGKTCKDMAAIYTWGFSKLAKKNIRRIGAYTDEKICLFAFQKWSSYPLVAFMMGLGIYLRHYSSLPKSLLAILYLGIGSALFASGLLYFAHIIRSSRPQQSEAKTS